MGLEDLKVDPNTLGPDGKLLFSNDASFEDFKAQFGNNPVVDWDDEPDSVDLPCGCS